MDADTGAFNYSGLEENMRERAGMFYGMRASDAPGQGLVANDLTLQLGILSHGIGLRRT